MRVRCKKSWDNLKVTFKWFELFSPFWKFLLLSLSLFRQFSVLLMSLLSTRACNLWCSVTFVSRSCPFPNPCTVFFLEHSKICLTKENYLSRVMNKRTPMTSSSLSLHDGRQSDAYQCGILCDSGETKGGVSPQKREGTTVTAKFLLCFHNNSGGIKFSVLTKKCQKCPFSHKVTHFAKPLRVFVDLWNPHSGGGCHKQTHVVRF